MEDTNINSYCNDVGSGGIGSDSCYEEQEDPSINDPLLKFKHHSYIY